MKKKPANKSRTRKLNKWQLYEREKAIIAATARSCQEYEERIYKLSKKLGI